MTPKAVDSIITRTIKTRFKCSVLIMCFKSVVIGVIISETGGRIDNSSEHRDRRLRVYQTDDSELINNITQPMFEDKP